MDPGRVEAAPASASRAWVSLRSGSPAGRNRSSPHHTTPGTSRRRAGPGWPPPRGRPPPRSGRRSAPRVASPRAAWASTRPTSNRAATACASRSQSACTMTSVPSCRSPPAPRHPGPARCAPGRRGGAPARRRRWPPPAPPRRAGRRRAGATPRQLVAEGCGQQRQGPRLGRCGAAPRCRRRWVDRDLVAVGEGQLHRLQVRPAPVSCDRVDCRAGPRANRPAARAGVVRPAHATLTRGGRLVPALQGCRPAGCASR